MIASILNENLPNSYCEKRIKEVFEYEKTGVITSSSEESTFSSEEKKEAK